MHIHTLLCVAAILSVTQSTPIAVTHNDVDEEGVTNEKLASLVQNPADFVDVNAPRSKRNYQQGVQVGPGHVSAQTHSGGGQVTYTVPIGDGCLYGDDFVLLQDGSRKQLKNLRSGDKVYSVDKEGKRVKDEIIMMLHGGPKVEAQFYMLTTSWNRTISLTGHHLILKYSPQEKRSQMVAAYELKAGDYLLMSGQQQIEAVPIISIEVFNKTGIYTPMTYKGTLFVNDIAVSCYVKHFNKYNELHTLLYPFRLYYYLIKDVLRLNEEPFSADLPVPSFVYADDEFYGTKSIKWLHQSKNMLRFIGHDLLLNTFSSI